MDYIKKTELGCKDTGGVVGTPQYQDSTTIISTMSADMKNSDSDLNQTASSENRSAKFKNPSVKQSPTLKGDNQYQEYAA